MDMFSSSLYLVITAGLLDSFNPCAIAVLLIFIALMLTFKKSRRVILILGITYIFAIYLTYLAIGVGLLRAAHLFNIPQIFTQIIGWVLIGWGVWGWKDYFFPKLPFKLSTSVKQRQIIASWAEKFSIPTTLVMGFFVAIFGFPCTGGIYLATLALLAHRETYLKGIGFLLVYNLMFVMPLILIFLAATNRFVAEKIIDWNEKKASHLKFIIATITMILGLILVFYLTK
ncbi:MAG: cytochrome c biosis transrane protein [Candidatus Berkelbacteria bacterium]|nr:cytochrome c biosis transrane protein [Candidatus Berkelbacteria bacterium]